jgi:Histidine kinase
VNDAMATMIDSVAHGQKRAAPFVADFIRWSRAHRGAVTMAGLLSFAAPVTFVSGAASVMREPTAMDLLVLVAWFVLFGVELWGLLLVIGYALQRVKAARRYALSATLLGACAAAGITELSNGRGYILVEQGVVQSIQTMHAYAFVFALIMALLFFAHLHRSRAQEEAAARLAAAQAAQHEARRRLGQARLQAVQARIDPQLLFEMLDAVRHAYEEDASRAERLLDELASFLRAALPRLRSTSSSVLREAHLARAYVQLRTLAAATDIDVRLEVSSDVANARFPPGVLLPLLDDALRARTGACELIATRSSSDCQLVLTLPARPLDAAVARVRSLLASLYGASAELAVAHANGVASATVKVPYELA